MKLDVENFKDLLSIPLDSPASCQLVVNDTLKRVKQCMTEGGVLKPEQTLRDYCLEKPILEVLDTVGLYYEDRDKFLRIMNDSTV